VSGYEYAYYNKIITIEEIEREYENGTELVIENGQVVDVA
jgi:hypothetical protein